MAQIRYCMTYADYKEDRWTELDTLTVKERSRASKFWMGGNDFQIGATDDSLKKVLRKEAFAIAYGDTLLINCRKLRYEESSFGKGYTLAHPYAGRKLCFVSSGPSNGSEYSAAIAGGILFGAVGAGIAGGLYSSSDLRKTYCFLLGHERRDGTINVHRIDDKYMERYEQSSPDFYADYMSEKKQKKRQSAAHVLPLLRDWQLIQ